MEAAGDIQPALVDAKGLDQVGEALIDVVDADGPHFVQVVMGRQKHEAGALLFGLPDRLSRLYSVLFGGFVLGQDDAVAGPWVAADGHRDLPQSGLVQQLHRGVKAVQITVQYDALSHAFHLPAQQISLAVYDTMSVPFLYALYTLYALLAHFSCTLYALLWAGSLSPPSIPPFRGQKRRIGRSSSCAPPAQGAHTGGCSIADPAVHQTQGLLTPTVALQVLTEKLHVSIAGVAQAHLTGDVGGDEQVLRRPGRVADGDRLLLKHIQSRAGKTVVVQGVQKGGLVDGAAAAHVDHIGGLRQQGEARRGEKPLRLTGGGQGQGKDIRIRQEGVQLVVGMDLVKGGVGGLFGAADTADSGGAQDLGAAGELGADIAGADDAIGVCLSIQDKST